PFGPAAYGQVIAQVERGGVDDLVTGPPQLLGERAEFSGVDVGEYESSSLGRTPTRHRSTDATRCAGHQDQGTVDRLHRSSHDHETKGDRQPHAPCASSEFHLAP